MCWFCASLLPRDPSIGVGLPFRCFLHNCTTRYSSAGPQLSFDDRLHFERTESAGICGDCIDRLHKETHPLSADYASVHGIYSDNLMSEICDVEMGMIEPWEMTYTIGCWFGIQPLLANSGLFQSFEVSRLIEHGLRFAAPIFLSEIVAAWWLQRQIVTEDGPVSGAVVDYLRKMVRVGERQPDDELVLSIASVRCRILDLTVRQLHHIR
jgi:hypothetical protein